MVIYQIVYSSSESVGFELLSVENELSNNNSNYSSKSIAGLKYLYLDYC